MWLQDTVGKSRRRGGQPSVGQQSRAGKLCKGQIVNIFRFVGRLS